MEIVVEQKLFLNHAFNYMLVSYVLVSPLQPVYCICDYQNPSDIFKYIWAGPSDWLTYENPNGRYQIKLV